MTYTSGMVLTVPRFDFPRLVRSHGWVQLAPFTWDDRAAALARPLRLPSGDTVGVTVTARRVAGNQTVLTVTPARRLAADDRAGVRRQVRRMLWLDHDFGPFHAACRGHPLLGFVSRVRCGAMLRSPTAFEDLVKTVCTTNCDWRNTRKMCDALCRLGNGDFPTPAEVLAIAPDDLARQTPLGYRVRTVHELARLTADGRLPLDEWAAAGRFAEASAALGGVWGVGPYARKHALMLLGDFSDIPVDCEVLKYLRTTHFDGRPVSAAEAVAPYAEFDRFRFLAFKFGRMARRAALPSAARPRRQAGKRGSDPVPDGRCRPGRVAGPG